MNKSDINTYPPSFFFLLLNFYYFVIIYRYIKKARKY